jgi:Fe-Mn family superoxide dismutase
MPFKLSPLPYEKDALKPYISAETLEYHYGKHHQAYVNKLNALTKDTPLAEKSLETLIKTETGGVFNNAAQIWNHDFYWQCLSPKKSEPTGELEIAINKTFGSLDKFKQAFKEKALANFGSGWTWLVKDTKENLEIINTSNAANPLTDNKTPLLTCDVWEHAYYIDYRNERGIYLDNFWPLVNWAFVEKKFNAPA